MGYSNTTKLALRKDDGNESIVGWRAHNNSNLDLIDATVGNLVDAINNAKLLLGQLGYDQNGNPVVDADTARDTLDAAQSENAAGSLYDAEQAIGVNAGSIATNAAAIASLQDSVSKKTYSITNDMAMLPCVTWSLTDIFIMIPRPLSYDGTPTVSMNNFKFELYVGGKRYVDLQPSIVGTWAGHRTAPYIYIKFTLSNAFDSSDKYHFGMMYPKEGTLTITLS